MKPIIIGCTAGSGSRIVAEILALADINLGPFNENRDAAHLVEWHNKWCKPYLAGAADETAMAKELQEKIDEHNLPLSWKEPRSLFILPFLARCLPGMRFVHVLRDPRDRCLYPNFQLPVQVEMYGQLFDAGEGPILERMARFWANANRKGRREGKKHTNYYSLRLEDLCERPHKTAKALFRWLGVGGNPSTSIVARPQSLGYYKKCPAESVNRVVAVCRDAMRAFGYRV
jgi:hypothetical protein